MGDVVASRTSCRPAARLEAGEVRAALTREMIVEHFHIEVRGREDGWWRGRQCPACRKRWGSLAGSGFCIGQRGWVCKACSAKGDLLDLVGRMAGLNLGTHFTVVLSLAAALAGVTPDANPVMRASRRVELAKVELARRRAAAIAETQRRHEARQTARSIWDGQLTDHPSGRAYLAGRGLDAGALIARGAVRFCPVGWRPADQAGDPTVALYDWDGTVLSVVRRRIALDEPKAPGLTGHPADGTLVGHVGQITKAVDVIVTEGVVDSLTAALAWPHAVVLGAHGAAQLPAVVAGAAPRVKAAGGRLIIVPDPDQPGQDAAVEAARHALKVGFSLDRDLDVVELGAGRDLNAAWCAGWRP